MDRILVFCIFFSIPLISLSQTYLSTEKERETLKDLGSKEFQDYNNEAIRMIRALGKYLACISNNNLPEAERRMAMDLIPGLFVNDTTIIEDSLYSQGLSHVYYIKDFIYMVFEDSALNSMIEWNDFSSEEAFSSRLNLKRVTFEQVLIKTNRGAIIRLKKTNKLVYACLKLEKTNNGEGSKKKFRVRLGNIIYLKTK